MRITSKDNLKLWTERVQAWQKSNMGMSAWCREHSLDYRQFMYWKIRLVGKKQKPAPFNFIEVPPATSQNSLTLEVGGFRIQISSC